VVTHKLALLSAEVLALYCEEHWRGKIGKCDGCMFELVPLRSGGKPSCYLSVFLGQAGERLQRECAEAVRKNCKKLSEREEKPDA
jgi:hypothetical protein